MIRNKGWTPNNQTQSNEMENHHEPHLNFPHRRRVCGDRGLAGKDAGMTHTQGPWRIAKNSWPMTITGNVHQITNDDRFPTAFIPAWDAPEVGEVNGTDEALANARLIAAAPELLEALKAITSDECVHGAFDMARAAIAKAEGREK